MGRVCSMNEEKRNVCSFLIHTGRTPWTGNQPVTRPLTNTEQHKHRINIQTSMPRVGFEPTISAFERSKTVHVLEAATTVKGSCTNSH
jgi:hypothetical protein